MILKVPAREASGREATHVIFTSQVPCTPEGGGGGALPIMDYMGRLRPKGVPFSGWRYIKG